MRMLAARPASAALAGLLLVLPLFLLNVIVGHRVEPLFSMIRPGIHTSPLERVLLAFVLFLLPVGAFIAVSPMLRRGPGQPRRFYVANGAVAALLIVLFAVIFLAVAVETYRCDVLQVPNCD